VGAAVEPPPPPAPAFRHKIFALIASYLPFVANISRRAESRRLLTITPYCHSLLSLLPIIEPRVPTSDTSNCSSPTQNERKNCAKRRQVPHWRHVWVNMTLQLYSEALITLLRHDLHPTTYIDNQSLPIFIHYHPSFQFISLFYYRI
jgi:hypothetical protein